MIDTCSAMYIYEFFTTGLGMNIVITFMHHFTYSYLWSNWNEMLILYTGLLSPYMIQCYFCSFSHAKYFTLSSMHLYMPVLCSSIIKWKNCPDNMGKWCQIKAGMNVLWCVPVHSIWKLVIFCHQSFEGLIIKFLSFFLNLGRCP